MNATEKIFKAYDIRGIYQEEIGKEDAFCIGYALGVSGLIPRDKPIIIGRDSRIGSEALYKDLASGLMSRGFSILDIGVCTSPMLTFAVNTLTSGGGVMVTASHNPKEYVGFKIIDENAAPISGNSGLNFIKNFVLSDYPYAPKIGDAQYRKISMLDEYADFFAEEFDVWLGQHVVIDTGNGAAGAILPAVMKTQHVDYTSLNFIPDGNFPSHDPDPTDEKNLKELVEAVAAERINGAIGVAFDGDGDRVVFIDEYGNRVRGDVISSIIIEDLLINRIDFSGDYNIIYDVCSSRTVPETILKYGGKPIKTRMGHTFIKQAFIKFDAAFAGESSSHYYFKDFFGCDSGIYAMLTILKIMDYKDMSLASLASRYESLGYKGEVNFRIDNIQAALDSLEKAFPDASIDRTDGLTFTFTDTPREWWDTDRPLAVACGEEKVLYSWWFNVRPSNTEPLLRLNIETPSPIITEEKIKLIMSNIYTAIKEL